MNRLGLNLWELLKGLSLAILPNLGLWIIAGLFAFLAVDTKTLTIFWKIGEILVRWACVVQLTYLVPMIWRRWQTKRIMALGLLAGLLLMSPLNYQYWKSNQEREARQPHFNYEYIYRAPEGDIRLTYSSFQKQGTGPTGRLEDLFKAGPQTGVDLSQAQYFTFTFPRTPYVQEYRFTLTVPTTTLSENSMPIFRFSSTGKWDEVNSYDFTKFSLTSPQTVATIKSEGHFFGLLRNSTIQLDLKKQDPKFYYEDYRGSPVYLTGLKVIYSDRPVGKPTITLQEIENKYSKGRKSWHFDGWFKSENDPLNEEHLKIETEVLRSLLALGLQGNKRAENLFENYRPGGSCDSEWASGLQSWYHQTKKANELLK